MPSTPPSGSSPTSSLSFSPYSWFTRAYSAFNLKAKSLPSLKLGRYWVSVAVIALLATYLRGIGSPLSVWNSGKGVPVVLTHGPNSVLIGGGNGTDGETERKSLIDVVKSCPSLYGEKARYVSTWWLFSGHLQTMWNTLGDHTKTDVIDYQRIYLRVPGNGTLVLDTYPPFESTEDDTPIVLVLHGLTGSSQESYARSTVGAVTKSKADGGPGFRAIVLNFRGCDGTPVTSSQLYHAGETDDTRSVLLYLTHKYPNAPIYAVGFSMGASTLAVYLGEEGENTPIKASVLVSNPWDWVAAATWIETGTFMNKYVYGPILADALRTIFKNNLHAFPPNTTGIDIPKVLAKKFFTIRWYDDHVTSKLFGFEDGHDYYVKTSSKQYMKTIGVPMLSLHSTDDPIVAGHNMPWDEVVKTDNVIFASTHGGGHVGWFTDGHGGLLKRWYTTPMVEFLEALYKLDPAPKAAPPMLSPDDNGLIRQGDLPEGRNVGFFPYEGEAFKPTGRSIQGF